MPIDNKLNSESQIIDDLKVLFESSKGRIGIGDDAAVIEHNQLISTDAIVEGVHFIRGKATWEEVAYKLFASNASDIAAMGGFVTGYTLTLSLPEYWTNADLKSFIAGIRLFLKEYPADLLGGDTVKSKEFFASVTVLGRIHSAPWLRSSAKEGDFIYCTGTLGDSKLWLNRELKKQRLPLRDLEYFRNRHYKPSPRNNMVPFLKNFNITSAMDISDGLVEDLQKLCKASQTSFYLDGNSIPISEKQIGIENVLEHKIYYQREALIGGEDYELLFTCPEPLDEEVLKNDIVQITRIGRLLSAKDQSFILHAGERLSLDQFKGYQH